MCEAKPGVRCAADTQAKSQQSLADYIRSYPGGPSVDPLASAEAMQAVLDMTTTAPQPPSSDATSTAFDMSRLRPGPPPIEQYGPVDDTYGPFPTLHNDWNFPDPHADTVIVEGREYHKRQVGVYPNWPYSMRIEADRELTNEEVRRLSGLVGYAARAELRLAEPVGAPHRDGPNSFVVSMDTTKTFSDDLGVALADFEQSLPNYFNDGSPVRKTDRAGVGTKGTRAVEGVPDVNTTLWYDDVYTDQREKQDQQDTLARLRAALAGDTAGHRV